MIRILVIGLVFLATNAAYAAFGSPSLAKLTIYGMAVSTNADCSNALVVGYNATGVEYDFKQSPTLFAGNIAAGTYQCVILYMKSLLTFKPTTTVGNCDASTTYVRNVCNNSQYTPASPDSSNILVYGSLTNSSATSSQDITNYDKVLLYLSTGSVGTGQTGKAFQRPDTAGSDKGIKLGAPFVVSSSGSTGTFVVNFDNALDGGQNPCDLGPPTFTFR